MSAVVVVTDSVACLPSDVAARHGIRIVPVRVTVGDTVYRDGVDVTPEAVYAWLRQGLRPTTAQPAVGDFLAVYRELAAQGRPIVSIHVTSALTGVYQAAAVAASQITEVPIRVIDSRAATMAQGFLALEAARVAERGGSLQEAEQAVRALQPRLRFFAMLETVAYLVRSGRAPRLARLAVDVLQVKPILTIRDGEIVVMDRVRTRRRAVESMLQRLATDAGTQPLHIAVMHAAAAEEAERLRSEIERRFTCVEAYVTPFSPAMGLYTGPGLLGLAYYAEHP